ncbi:MAG: pyridoxamine 5'-phosphate oxidase family protein [Ilumatobacteraceae bacterium]
MKLDRGDALARLAAGDHGVLCTRHPERGVDAVPAVFALDQAGFLGIPVDRVKPKSSLDLQRVRNLEDDPRATLLVDHWDPRDWAALWWVRAQLRWVGETEPARSAELARRLADRYPQYQDAPFARVLVFRVDGVQGWSAAEGSESV